MVKKILCSSFVLFHRLPDICCVRSSWWTKSSFTEPPYYWSPGRELRPEWSSRWRQKFRAREDLPLTIHLVVAFVKSHLWRQRPRVIKARRLTKHFIVSSCDSQLLGTEWSAFDRQHISFTRLVTISQWRRRWRVICLWQLKSHGGWSSCHYLYCYKQTLWIYEPEFEKVFLLRHCCR